MNWREVINKTSLLYIGVTFIIIEILFDSFILKIPVICEDDPYISFVYIFRTLIIFIGTFLIFLSLINKNKFKNNIRFEKSLQAIILFTFIIVIFFWILFLYSPWQFSQLSLEDGIIEFGSFILLIGSSIILFTILHKIWHIDIISKYIKVFYLVLMFVLFVIAMEEVSWFQRVLSIETPEYMESNLQNEINLHNFATNYIESIYYFGAFVFLVFIPFLKITNHNLLTQIDNNLLIGGPVVGIIGSLSCAFNYDMWNIVFTQIAYVFSLFYLIFLLSLLRNKIDYVIISCLLIFMMVSQLTFILKGDSLIRYWEITEYREFIIPIGFLVYTISINRYINAHYFVKNKAYETV